MSSTQKLRHRILAVGALLVVAFTGSAVFDSWRLHQQIVAATHRELGNLARALAEEADSSLQSVDVLLADTAQWYENDGSRLDGPAVEAALVSRAANLAQVSVLTIVDANGNQLYRSRVTGEPFANVADRPYFVNQRERPAGGLFINEPIVTRTERQPALVISRRLNGPDGRFMGVVTAIVTLKELSGMYSAIELGDASELLLTLDDGTLVVRQPSRPDLEGSMKLANLVALKGGPIIDTAISPMDGRVKLIAALGVGTQPLVLAVMRDEEQALVPWYDEVRSGVVRTVALSLLVVLTVFGLLRQLRRIEQGEQALRDSEERYAMSMEAANEGHAEWNIGDDTLFASEKWRTLHGVAPGDPVAGAADVLRHLKIHPDDIGPVRAAIEAHLAGRTPAIEVEYRVDPGEGNWRWIHARGRCLLDDAGKPVRLFCAATDVSARKASEVEKQALETRLQQTQRLEALGTLAGGIAHDFNNILGAILGFGEMAQHQAEPGSAMRRHIDRVMQAGARARVLVRGILDFSRSGVAERVPVHIQSVVEEVIAMLTPSLPAGLRVQARLESGDSAVIGDGTQLYQVVMNLCTNAIQAIGDTGLLSVDLHCHTIDAPRPLFHGDLRSGEYVCLDVTDTGSGISADALQRMFDPFFTTKPGGEGTGLGLSVVHGIVSDLGGAIDVASTVGQGTRVSVWLPVVGECARKSPGGASDRPHGHGEVVMIVDDEAALVELAEELLAELGYEPVGFGSAESALLAFETDPRRFDALLSDEMLPGMAGSELARRVLLMRPELPVMLMSGKVSDALEHRARSAGVRAVLSKPLGLKELAEALARLLQPA